MALFPHVTEQPLERPLKDPITFERFMEYCLYHPSQGYYRRSPGEIFGRGGDYITSPYTHELFAHCLADYFYAWFLHLDQPAPFHVCELGAGGGRLAGQILTYLATAFPGLSEVVHYVEIDVDRGDLPEGLTGIVFSNEFFDALPVHRVCVSGGELKELHVVQQGEELREVSGPLSDPRIGSWLKGAFRELKEDWIYEVNLRMANVLRALDQRIGRGAVLTIDYGYTEPEYQAMPRPAGTLACYRNHQVSYNPCDHPGEQDMTCHVHWGMLMQSGRDLGWKNQELMTQRDFLMGTGLAERLIREETAGLFSTDRLSARLEMKQLLCPGGISDTLRVLVQEVRCPGLNPVSARSEQESACE